MSGEKARAIFTNDAECDDMNSYVHLLLCANEVDIEGLVLSSSVFHYAGDPAHGIEPYRWAGGDWMWEYLDEYEKVYPNLLVHDAGFPAPDYLRGVTCIGNVKTVGDMDEDTDGSELIRAAILKDDPRPVYLLAGGGTNTIGRALKRIESDWRGTDEWDTVYGHVCRQAIIYMIVTQDDTYRDYISKSWPDLRILHCTNIKGIAFKFNEERDPADSLYTFSGPWLKANLLDKGPLCARYHTWFDGHVYPGEEDKSQFGAHPELVGKTWGGLPAPEQYAMISEGDSPAFLHLIDKGLRSLENPSWGGWGGRFARNEASEFGDGLEYFQSAVDDDCGACAGYAFQLTRWIRDVMNDLACRAAWCVEGDYACANHAPSVRVREGVDIDVAAGERVVLRADADDPDGDEVTLDWFRYHEADTYAGEVALEANGAEATLNVPADARSGDTIHVIVRASDASSDDSHDPYMAVYQRVVLTVQS